MFMNRSGIMIRIPAKDISVIGRNTPDARIMRMAPNDRVVSVAKVMGENVSNGDSE